MKSRRHAKRVSQKSMSTTMVMIVMMTVTSTLTTNRMTWPTITTMRMRNLSSANLLKTRQMAAIKLSMEALLKSMDLQVKMGRNLRPKKLLMVTARRTRTPKVFQT